MLQTPRVCKPGMDARGVRQSAELTQESDDDDAAEYARHDQSCVAGLLWLLVAPVGRPAIVVPVATVNTSGIAFLVLTGFYCLSENRFYTMADCPHPSDFA